METQKTNDHAKLAAPFQEGSETHPETSGDASSEGAETGTQASTGGYQMTHYDKLIDVIKDHLYGYYISGQQGDGWDEADSQESASMILQAVEEFQTTRSKLNQWRASD